MTAPHVDLTLSPHVLPAHTHAEYAPTEHTHSGYAATSHSHTPASLGAAATSHTHGAGQILAAPRAVTYADLAALAPAAGVAVDVVTATLTGNPTITPAAGADGQIIRLRLLAGTSSRTVTLGSSVRTATGIADRALTIPANEAGVFGLERVAGLGSGVWVLFSKYATAT